MQTKYYREFELKEQTYRIYVYSDYQDHVHLYRQNLKLKSGWSWVVTYSIDKDNKIVGISESSGLHEPENDHQLKQTIQDHLDIINMANPNIIVETCLGTVANYNVTLFKYKNGQKVYEIYCPGDPNGISLTEDELKQLFALTNKEIIA